MISCEILSEKTLKTPCKAHLFCYLSSQMLSLTVWPHVSVTLLKWWRRGAWWVGYLCQIEWAVSPVLPGGKGWLLGYMAHISLLCCHDKEGKLISHGTSRKILSLSGKGLCMRQGFFHTPSVHVPLTLCCLHNHSFTLLWNDCLSVVVLVLCHLLSAALNSKEDNSYFCSVCSLQGIY